jgi:hypothetical protein
MVVIMTEVQMLIILGTIWIAPTLNANYCQVVGLIFIGAASIKGLGWI